MLATAIKRDKSSDAYTHRTNTVVQSCVLYDNLLYLKAVIDLLFIHIDIIGNIKPVNTWLWFATTKL